MCNPLHMYVVAVAYASLFAHEQTRLVLAVRLGLHLRKPLEAATLSDTEDQEHVVAFAESLTHLASWTVCGRPDVVLERDLQVLFVVAFQDEEATVLFVGRRGVDDLFPGCSLLWVEDGCEVLSFCLVFRMLPL